MMMSVVIGGVGVVRYAGVDGKLIDLRVNYRNGLQALFSETFSFFHFAYSYGTLLLLDFIPLLCTADFRIYLYYLG